MCPIVAEEVEMWKFGFCYASSLGDDWAHPRFEKCEWHFIGSLCSGEAFWQQCVVLVDCFSFCFCAREQALVHKNKTADSFILPANLKVILEQRQETYNRHAVILTYATDNVSTARNNPNPLQPIILQQLCRHKHLTRTSNFCPRQK